MTPFLAQLPRTDRSFERLYRRHVLDVYRYALVVLRSREDAEDVTQTTFMNAYRAYKRGERPRAARNWLIAIAHNVCRQRFRQATRRPQEVEFDDAAEQIVPDDDAPSASDIVRALGYLAFNQRAALVMREIEGRSYQEIAEILGVSTGAVETLVFRARRALREQLEGSLTCHEAERAVSRQLDGQLPRSERGALRAHLRACEDCAHFARSQRAQRSALRAFAMVPLPSSLTSFFGTSVVGGSAGALAGSGVLAKGAAALAAGMVATGVSYEGAKQAGWTGAKRDGARAAAAVPAMQGLTGKPGVPLSAPRARPQTQLPGFERNAAKPGRRVGPKGAVRARILERKELQATRRATRRQAKAKAARARAESRGRARRPAQPPGRAKRPSSSPGQARKPKPKGSAEPPLPLPPSLQIPVLPPVPVIPAPPTTKK